MSLLTAIRNSETAAVAILTSRCLRYRFRHSSCARCLNECPARALRLEKGKIVLDAKRCGSCLACAAVCPTEALLVNDSSLAGDQDSSTDAEPLSFCCEKGIRTGKEIVLPCLGALSEEHLAAYAVRRPLGVQLRIAPCATCRTSFIPELLHRRLAALAGKLDGGISARIRLVDQKDENGHAGPAAGRRLFFRAFWALSRHTATETAATLRDEGRQEKAHAHKHRPSRFSLLRRTMAVTPDPAMVQALARLFFTLRANEACTFCGRCAGMCPTGAIKNSREEDQKRLHFLWPNCSGCGLCLEACGPRALTLVAGRRPETLATDQEILLQADRA